jgi:hypothetical protein
MAGGGSPRKVAPDRVISTVDPEARHAHKSRERRQDGFKAHVVIEPDTGLTTAAAVTKVNGPENSDAAVGAALVDGDPTLPQPEQGEQASRSERVEVLGDSAYRSGEMLDALDRADRDGRCQADPAPPRGRGRVHPGRLRLRRGGGHPDLPQPDHQTAIAEPAGRLRQDLRRLPAAGTLHHIGHGPQHEDR